MKEAKERPCLHRNREYSGQDPTHHPTCVKQQHIFCSHKKMTKATENNTQGVKSPPQTDSQLDKVVHEVRMQE